MSKFGKPSDASRLPVSRSSSKESEFGYEEPEIVPRGKITLKQALRVLTDKQVETCMTADRISKTLNISMKDAG